MKKEIWKSVVGYKGLYEVSNQGRIHSLRCNRILHSVMCGKPAYPVIRLHKNNKRKGYRIHRLVLFAFRGPCPKGKEASHLNDIKIKNHLENLQWMTRSENLQLAVKNGRNPWLGKHHSVKTRRKMKTSQRKRRKNERNKKS